MGASRGVSTPTRIQPFSHIVIAAHSPVFVALGVNSCCGAGLRPSQCDMQAKLRRVMYHLNIHPHRAQFDTHRQNRGSEQR